MQHDFSRAGPEVGALLELLESVQPFLDLPAMLGISSPAARAVLPRLQERATAIEMAILDARRRLQRAAALPDGAHPSPQAVSSPASFHGALLEILAKVASAGPEWRAKAETVATALDLVLPAVSPFERSLAAEDLGTFRDCLEQVRADLLVRIQEETARLDGLQADLHKVARDQRIHASIRAVAQALATGGLAEATPDPDRSEGRQAEAKTGPASETAVSERAAFIAFTRHLADKARARAAQYGAGWEGETEAAVVVALDSLIGAVERGAHLQTWRDGPAAGYCWYEGEDPAKPTTADPPGADLGEALATARERTAVVRFLRSRAEASRALARTLPEQGRMTEMEVAEARAQDAAAIEAGDHLQTDKVVSP